MKKLWLVSFLGLLCISSGVGAQVVAPPVVVNTAMSDAIYTPGIHVGDPIIVPPAANMFRLTLDRTLCLDAAVSVNFNLERFDGSSWQPWAGAGTRCGAIVIRGNPVSASSFSTALPPSDQPIRAVYEISGGNAPTNSAISMWEVLP